jgi:outer membrane immunogenic protein
LAELHFWFTLFELFALGMTELASFIFDTAQARVDNDARTFCGAGGPMRNDLLCGVATGAIAVVFCGPLVATDLPARPVVKAPAPAVFNWSGFYIGGHLGYGQSRFRGWDGSSVAFDTRQKPQGIVGGVHAGHNWQVNTFVYGWEADVSATGGWTKSGAGIHVRGGSASIASFVNKVALLASLRARLGISSPDSRSLFYVTGGLAYAHASYKATHCSTTDDNPCLPFTTLQRKFNRLGAVVGLGAEWKQTQNLSWRVEGLYYIFDDKKDFPVSPEATDIKFRDVWVARVGATYHFGGSAGAEAPVAGRPVVKAPVPPAVFSWSGFYIGGHLGYGQSRFRGWDGSSVAFNTRQKPQGIVGGMHAGQNWQLNTFVYGWEADVSATGWTKDAAALAVHGSETFASFVNKVALLASLRARLGISSPDNRSLFYVTGGLAYAHANYKASHCSTTDAACAPFTTLQRKFNSLGAVVGLGAEWKQTQNFSWRVEGLYYIFNDKKDFPITPETTNNIKFRDAWVARVGATYHFDGSGWGIAPVAARY